ncbi:MAG TPA: FAD-dependent oxidoreductase [Nocardioidaceae bacterium]|nr:FAD-dependent oxidoreductase [Nocardioidaceae bacterium]
MSALKVAIVGSGPAGCYAAGLLLERPDVHVDLFDRLPTPWGLVRAGVAPDHRRTKQVADSFERLVDHPRFRFHLNVEIGTHISHEELVATHHAVLYSVGASEDRRLEIPGEDLPGSHAATEFVGWYNGHPDHRHHSFDLSAERAVVIGNGNVALDIARILAQPASALATTDIADHALEALLRSKVEEVVVLGRRGPVQAAYTTPELLGLGDLPDVDVVVDPAEVALDDVSRAYLDSERCSFADRLKTQVVREYAGRATKQGRRIVLRFLGSPVEIVGDSHVTGLYVVRNRLVDGDPEPTAVPTEESELVETGLVLRSVGYRARPVPGLPFDQRRGVIPNTAGRVVDLDGRRRRGVYTAGWIKRGPSGVIGTNKRCAAETVTALLQDHADGLLTDPVADVDVLLAQRQPREVRAAEWRRIDAHETRAGQAHGRPRIKLTEVATMLEVAGR